MNILLNRKNKPARNGERKKVCIGIDLGTTFSSVAFMTTDSNDLTILEDCGSQNIPSWVAFDVVERDGKLERSGEPEVGQRVKNSSRPFLFYDGKRLIGRTWDEYDENEKNRCGWPFDVTVESEGASMYYINDGKQFSVTPREIASCLIKKMVTMVKNKFSREQYEIVQYVVTFPVDFSQRQIEETKRACRDAGIPKDKLELLQEPIASIIAFQNFRGRQRRNDQNEDENRTTGFIVVDFGGGTLDICRCWFNERVLENIGYINDLIHVNYLDGDQNIGGNNFDDIIIDIVKEKVNALWNGEKYFDNEITLKEGGREQLKKNAEFTKTELVENIKNLNFVILVDKKNFFDDETIQQNNGKRINEDELMNLDDDHLQFFNFRSNLNGRHRQPMKF